MLESVKEKPQWLFFFNSLMRHDGDNACYQDAAQSRAVLIRRLVPKGNLFVPDSSVPTYRLLGRRPSRRCPPAESKGFVEC